jgi:hypothetical protein
MEPCKEFKSPQVSFLHRIFGVMIVACQPACQVIGSVQMRQNGLFETPDFVLFLQQQLSPRIQTIVGFIFQARCHLKILEFLF